MNIENPESLEKSTTLIEETKKLIKEDEELRKKNGEDFNIFSILRMETSETKTHSGMIAALLNPKGNHYQGSVFLKLFLDIIDHKYDVESENLDKAIIKLEHYLGAITKDYEDGGYIDILITFPSGKTIAIENKINAEDQPNQLYRYSKHNTNDSTLYYLNLLGVEPSEISTKTLKSDQFKVISYQNNILSWLKDCLEIVNSENANNREMLHQSLKQYIKIVKKITNKMDNELQQKLEKLIGDNLIEAEYIAHNFENAKYKVRLNFRDKVKETMDKQLTGSSFKSSYNNNDGCIYLSNEETTRFGYEFAIGNFWGTVDNDEDGSLYYGIHVLEGKQFSLDLNDLNYDFPNFKSSRSWPAYTYIKQDNAFFNLASNEFLTLLNNPDRCDEKVEIIKTQLKNFIQQVLKIQQQQ